MKKEDLHKIAPTLSKNSTKTTGFKTPKGYFDLLEDKITTRLKSEALAKENTSNLPKDYFNSLENIILAKNKRIALKRNVFKIITPLAVAASFLLVVLLYNNSKNNLTFENLETADIEIWLDNSNVNIDAYNVATLYPTIEIGNSLTNNNLNDNDYLDYLNYQDLETIILEN